MVKVDILLKKNLRRDQLSFNERTVKLSNFHLFLSGY